MTRETRLASAFVELAEALVTGEELGAFLHLLSCRSIELLEVDAAGVMLADENDRLRAIAASNEDTHLLEVFALQHQEGVCLDVYRSGTVDQTSTAGTKDRWPHFSQVTQEHGYEWVCGVPLRHGNETIGALNLFRNAQRALGDDEIALAQALADVATVSLLQRRETTQAKREASQLQFALDSRVLIEQAKGVLAERLNISPDEAFSALRRECRNTNRKLKDVAHDVVHGKADMVARLSGG